MARYFIGTCGWHYDDWKGEFYPKDVPKTKWLQYYAQRFPTVELNNSFYGLPTEDTFRAWYNATPVGFTFAVKVSRYVTHIKKLRDAAGPVGNFVDRATCLKEKLGPLLYQLPRYLHRNDEVLETFLSVLPRNLRHVIEFRHESWFDEKVFEILGKHNTALCIFELPDVKSPVIATADFAYVRFHGPADRYSSKYTDRQMDEWAKKISGLAKGLDAVYAYFNNDVSGYALDNAEMLKRHLGIS